MKGVFTGRGWDSKRGVGWGEKANGSLFLGCCNFDGGDCGQGSEWGWVGLGRLFLGSN